MSTLDGLNDLNWWMLYVNTYYVDQGLSTFFKKRIFGSVLSDEKYEYLLLMLCESIDRIGFWYWWFFWNFWKYLKKFWFQKIALFLGFDGCLLCLVLIWRIGVLFGFRVWYWVVCVLFEVDFWIIFGCKECAQTLVLYSSTHIRRSHSRLSHIRRRIRRSHIRRSQRLPA